MGKVADTHAGAAVHRQVGDVFAVNVDVAVVGGNQAGNAIKTGCFSGAVGAEQADGLAAADVKGNVAQNRPIFITFADIKDFKFGIAVASVHLFLLRCRRLRFFVF